MSNSDQPQTSPSPVTNVRRRKRSLWIGGTLFLLLAVWGIASLDLSFSGAGMVLVPNPEKPVGDLENPDISPSDTTEKKTSSPAKVQPEQVLGHWVLNDSIRREIVIRPDGTATMDVKLDYIASFLYGSELKMQLTWNLKDNVLSHSIVSGEPKANVDRLTRDFGNSRSYRVVSVSDQDLVLESVSGGGEHHHWVAVED